MKNSFIRVLWGDGKFRNGKSHKESYNCLKICNAVPLTTVLCFGDYNYKYLKDIGWKNVIKISDDHEIYSENKQYINKIFAIQKSLEIYDRILFLDFDAVATEKIPDCFWEYFSDSEGFQAPLNVYVNRQLRGRRILNPGALPCGAFIYIEKSEKVLLDDTIKKFNINRSRKITDETILRKYIEAKMGGEWLGEEYYFEHFVPQTPVLTNKTAFHDKEYKYPKIFKIYKNLINIKKER